MLSLTTQRQIEQEWRRKAEAWENEIMQTAEELEEFETELDMYDDNAVEWEF